MNSNESAEEEGKEKESNERKQSTTSDNGEKKENKLANLLSKDIINYDKNEKKKDSKFNFNTNDFPQIELIEEEEQRNKETLEIKGDNKESQNKNIVNGTNFKNNNKSNNKKKKFSDITVDVLKDLNEKKKEEEEKNQKIKKEKKK